MTDQSLQDYLTDIGRIPLLTPAQEIILGRDVQAWMANKESAAPCPRIERRGRRAKDHMINANLRLVVSIAKRFTHGDHTLSQMDLIQAGNLGLIRGVEKFDPERGYRCSTYFYWWIRQGITRHIDECGRTIRIPTTHSDTAAKARRVASELAFILGRTPTRAELADELGVNVDELERLLLVSAGCFSLDAPVPGATSGDPANMVELLAAPDGAEPPSPRRDDLIELVGMLDARGQRLIRGRYGIDEPVATFAELAQREGITAHRVRGLCRMAENTLRRLSPAVSGPAAPAAAGPIRDAGEAVDQLELL